MWLLAKRVLRYLKGTLNVGLQFVKSDDGIVGFADADWGSNIIDRKSYTGYVFKFSNNVISWEAKKQKCVALSSSEAEYMALSEASKEAIFLKKLC